MKKFDTKLYFITDSCGFEEADFLYRVEEALKGGVTLLQLREKNMTTMEYISLAEKVHTLTKKYNVPLIIDDRIDVTLAVEAEGVHLGKEDIIAGLGSGIAHRQEVQNAEGHPACLTGQQPDKARETNRPQRAKGQGPKLIALTAQKSKAVQLHQGERHRNHQERHGPAGFFRGFGGGLYGFYGFFGFLLHRTSSLHHFDSDHTSKV